MKIKLNENAIVEIKKGYKKGNKLYCGQIKCNYIGSMINCVDCNVNHIQENNLQGNYMWVKYDDIKHLLLY